jgi:hypothetical protein
MIYIIMENERSRASSVGTAKDYEYDGRDYFLLPPLWPTQPPIKWVPEAPSPGVK